jgi:hypothetical protein
MGPDGPRCSSLSCKPEGLTWNSDLIDETTIEVQQMAKVLMVVQHPVKDFDAWRIEYDKAQPIRDKHQVMDATVFRNVDDPNLVTGLHWFASVDEAHAFANDPDLTVAMARAGVTGSPRIEIGVEA